MMLSKKDRLSSAEFSVYFKTGKKIHSTYATLIYTKHPHFHGSVVVGKKVDKRAVVRNKLRRRFYALLYTQLKLKQKTGVYIVILKPNIKSLNKKQQRQEIQKLIEDITKKT